MGGQPDRRRPDPRADAQRARSGGAQLRRGQPALGHRVRPAPRRVPAPGGLPAAPSPDIDLVIGHHAHVVQPIEQVGGTYVVFGLGNQLSGQRPTPRADGLTVVVHAKPQPGGRWKVAGIEAVPTYVEDGSYRVLPVVLTLQHGHPSPALAAELRASYDRTAAVLRSVPTPGITLAPRP
ncbi:MAG: CapA family protein [Acidimicrobiales bacterium]